MQEQQEKEKPPLFGSWTACYLGVVIFLVVQILLFYWLTRQFS